MYAITISVVPPTGNACEPDDECNDTNDVFTDSAIQRHTFHISGDADWVSFQVVSSIEHLGGLAYAGTLTRPEKWPLYVMWAQVGQVQTGPGVITVEVRDDKSMLSAWAVVYKPSYVPPGPGPVMLLDQNGDGVYTDLYKGFDEIGEYRVMVYAVDGEGFEGRPREIKIGTGWPVYLPLVLR